MTINDVLARANQSIQALIPYQPGKPIEELERELNITNSIKLASNENPYGCSPHVCDVITKKLDQLAIYPDADGFYLKQALAAFHQIDASHLTLGNGSNDVLELLAKTFISSASDEVVFSQYAFCVYPILTQALGAKAVVTPAQNWGHDLDAMVNSVTDNTKIIFLANPNNPTGTWFTSQQLIPFLQAIPNHVLVVLDEAYVEYADDPDYPDALSLLSTHANLVITRTFSKAYGIAGLRVGYAISHPEIADLLNRVRQPFNVNLLAQYAAVAALNDQAFIRQCVESNHAVKQELQTGLEQLNLAYIPSQTNFLTVQFDDAQSIYEQCLAQGVIVRPLANYQLNQHLRITIGTEQQNQRLLETLQQCLAN